MILTLSRFPKKRKTANFRWLKRNILVFFFSLSERDKENLKIKLFWILKNVKVCCLWWCEKVVTFFDVWSELWRDWCFGSKCEVCCFLCRVCEFFWKLKDSWECLDAFRFSFEQSKLISHYKMMTQGSTIEILYKMTVETFKKDVQAEGKREKLNLCGKPSCTWSKPYKCLYKKRLHSKITWS